MLGDSLIRCNCNRACYFSLQTKWLNSASPDLQSKISTKTSWRRSVSKTEEKRDLSSGTLHAYIFRQVLARVPHSSAHFRYSFLQKRAITHFERHSVWYSIPLVFLKSISFDDKKTVNSRNYFLKIRSNYQNFRMQIDIIVFTLQTGWVARPRCH